MHLCLASRSGRRLLSTEAIRHRASFALCFLPCVLLLTAGCRSAADAGDVLVESTITPARPVVDRETFVEVTLRDRSRRLVAGATLQVEAHMIHAGMAPVIEPAREQGSGVYAAHLSFSMSGAWELLVTGVLADGRRVHHSIGDATVGPRTSGPFP